MTRPDVDELVGRLHEQLRATEELPVDRTAGRWIGEAQAVAADAAEGDPPRSVVRERVGHVRRLLAEVDDAEAQGRSREGDALSRDHERAQSARSAPPHVDAGSEETNERVAAARDLADEILDRIDE